MATTTKKRLTNQVLERMSPPRTGRLEMGDELCPGLVLRVTEQGAKSFSVIYRVLGEGGETDSGRPLAGKQHRITLGKWPVISRAADRTAGLLKTWYQRQARRALGDRLGECLQHFPEIRKSPKLTVRKLTKRWGIMSPDGNHMLLNTRLVETPIDCIDYVIIHELCHVQEPHHGPAFFELLERKLPSWEKRKLRLERIMV